MPLLRMVLEQQYSDPPVPGREPHPSPPHIPQFSAQQMSASWYPGSPLVQFDVASRGVRSCQRDVCEWLDSISRVLHFCVWEIKAMDLGLGLAMDLLSARFEKEC